MKLPRTLAEKLRREKEDQRYKQWLTELRSRTKFEVNYQALEQETVGTGMTEGSQTRR